MEIPFSYVEQNFIVVPVKINDSITGKFVLDTGIGINLISKSLCEQLKCKIKGNHTGKRMSGSRSTTKAKFFSSNDQEDLRDLGCFAISLAVFFG